MKNLYKPAAFVLGGALGVYLLAKLLPIVLPFLCGWLLSAAARPATKRLAAHIRVPYSVISFVCLSLFATVLILLLCLGGRLLLAQLAKLGRQLPGILVSLEQPLGDLQQSLCALAQELPGSLGTAAEDWVGRLFDGSSGFLTTASQWLIGLAARVIAWIPELLLFLLTMVLSAYLFASQEPKLRTFVRKHLPEAFLARIKLVVGRLKSTLRGYFKAQLRLSLVTFLVVLVGLFFLKRNHAFVLSILIAFIDALPIFGAGTVLIPWSLILLLRGNSLVGFGLLAIYALASILRAALEPRFLGKQIGISPLVTLFALYSGYYLFGFWGLLLFPIGAMLAKQLYDLTKVA